MNFSITWRWMTSCCVSACLQMLLVRAAEPCLRVLQVIIRGFMILNEAEEQRKVANSAPLTSAEVLHVTSVGATAPAAMPATTSEASSSGEKTLSEARAPDALSQAVSKTARVAGDVATAVTQAAEKLPRLQDSAGGGAAQLSLTALAPQRAGLQSTSVAAQE